MADEHTDRADAVAWVERLHATVDALTAPVAAAHGPRLACRQGCAGCCVDELTVFEIEADVIRRRHGELLQTAPPRAPGACAFLDEAFACRIYDARPYVCRTQGLPLRWLDEDDEGETYEARDVCPLNLEGVALEELPADALWTLGPIEQRLATKQGEVDGGEGRRVPLRALFAGAAEEPPSPVLPRRLPVVR